MPHGRKCVNLPMCRARNRGYRGTMRPAHDHDVRTKVAYLADPRHFAGHPPAVEVIETHFAWVFLAGSYALKLKKPLRQGSLDYRTLARRERACRAELRLNRRIAPDVYLRVEPLWRTRDGRLSRRGGVRIIEWLVCMRRLPASRRLDQLLSRGALDPRRLAPLLGRLAAFFRGAEPRPLSDRAYRARLRAQIESSERELGAADLGLSRERVRRLARSQLEFLARNRRLFEGRGARLVDGHGDLRPEHVFLGPRPLGVSVIDCLEFDPRLRRLDPAEEMAFLALECARLGAGRVARALLAGYCRIMGDPASQALLDFYMSRRAAVRAQLMAWHLRDEAFAGERRAWRARAHSYLDEAIELCRRAGVGITPRKRAASVAGGTQAARPRPSGAPPRRREARPAT